MARPVSHMSNVNNYDPNRRKPQQPMGKTLGRLCRYLGEHIWLLAAAVALMVVGQACALACPKLSGKAIDAIGLGPGEADFVTVGTLAAVIAVLYLLSSFLTYFVNKIVLTVSRRVAYKMRRDVFNKLQELPVRYFDERQTGDILSVISYDIDTVNTSLTTDVLQIFTSIFTVVFALVMMATILPQLLLVFCVTVPASMLFTRYITRNVRPYFRKRSMALGMLNGYVEEMVSGQKTTRAYGREAQIICGFGKKNEEAVVAGQTAEGRSSFINSGMNFINNISQTMVSVFGAVLYFAGRAVLGDVSAFVQYARQFTGPIREAGGILGELQSAFAAAERVFALLDEEPEPADAPNAEMLVDVSGDVELEHVKFGYDPGKIIIKDLSMEAKPGTLVAIVGPTGAGKTTIINLLMRFYDVNDGVIRVDGKEICKVTRTSLRSAYTMVLQETWLFHGTIYENIAYGKENVTMEEVEAAAKAAGIHSFIRRLPKGYDTVISAGGTNISKGQKQMLTIARAMLMDSNMLILDEATSNVDTRTEQKIQKAMRELMKDKTCFVIAHRLSTIRHADNILVVRDGNVVEQGSHEELMAKKGFYSELYHSQFESY